MAIVSKLQNASKLLFSRYLLVTNTAICGGLLASGDFFTQNIEMMSNKNQKYDYKRTGRMFCMGFVLGPFTHVWYKVLDKYLPGKTGQTVFKKILADQAVAAPFFCSAFFFGMSVLEGKTAKEGIEEVQSKFLFVYLADWCIWPPAQFINFYFLPPHLRVAYVSTITLFWNTFASWIKHRESLPFFDNDAKIPTSHK